MKKASLLMLILTLVVINIQAFAEETMTMNALDLSKYEMNRTNYRHLVLTDNVARKDKAGEKAYDVKPLRLKSINDKSNKVTLNITSAKHIVKANNLGKKYGVERNKNPFEISPDGNEIVAEEQFLKINENSSDFQLANIIYKKNISMLRNATINK